MILLDTHVLRWLAEGDRKLGGRTLDRLRNDSELRASAISYLEFGMLSDKGKLVFSRPVRQWLDAILTEGGIEAVPVTTAVAVDAGTLPGLAYGDLADRILIATARSLGCALATADRRILDYGGTGRVLTVDARR